MQVMSNASRLARLLSAASSSCPNSCELKDEFQSDSCLHGKSHLQITDPFEMVLKNCVLSYLTPSTDTADEFYTSPLKASSLDPDLICPVKSIKVYSSQSLIIIQGLLCAAVKNGR